MPRRKNNLPDGLTTPQELALSALLEGKGAAAAAQAAGVAPDVLTAWRTTDPAFAAALRTRQAQAWDDFRDRAAHLAARALDTLAELLDVDDPKAKLSAARAILALANPPAPAQPSATTAEAVAQQWAENERMADALTPTW
jgi:hypothetical protein